MTADTDARRTAAAAVLADFTRDRAHGLTADDAFWWCGRLAAEVRSLLDVAEDQAATLDVARAALLDGPQPGAGLTGDDLREAFGEWEITEPGDGIWSARLTTSEDRPQPRLTACTPAELAAALNGFIGGAS